MTQLLRDSSAPQTLVETPIILKAVALQTQLFQSPGKVQMNQTTLQLATAQAAADKLREHGIPIDTVVLTEVPQVLAHTTVCIAIDYAWARILRAQSGSKAGAATIFITGNIHRASD